MSVMGRAVFLAQSHVDARHQRKVKGHVALIAVTEVGTDVCGPHVGFGEHQAIFILGVDHGANLFDFDVSLGHVLAACTVALDQIGDRVQA